jgi:hypothetical protein
MNRRSHSLSSLVAAVALFSLCSLPACPHKDPPPEPDALDAAKVAASNVPETVPPAAPFNATPVAKFADAGNLEGQSPLQQATVYEGNGQLWMARLVLEPKAFGSDGTNQEIELLAKICQQQGDADCVDKCGAKLGRKIKMDAGIASASADVGKPGALTGQEHKEPDTELARTRDMILKKQFDLARKSLEPKVLDGKASREEIRLLKTICEKQGDRMCVALCDSKLR